MSDAAYHSRSVCFDLFFRQASVSVLGGKGMALCRWPEPRLGDRSFDVLDDWPTPAIVLRWTVDQDTSERARRQHLMPVVHLSRKPISTAT